MPTELRNILPAKERKLDHRTCYWCGGPRLEDEMIAFPGNPMHQSFILALRTPCCHMARSTEHYGTILDYLCDGWARAQMICELYNKSVGHKDQPRPPRPSVQWKPDSTAQETP